MEEDFELELAALLTAQDAADPQEHGLRHEEPCSTAGVQPRKPKRQRRSPSDLAASPAPVAGLPGPLAQLSEALLLRVLCFLAPEDLMMLGRTSRLFHAAASDAGLWRRLYLHRCGGGVGRREALQGGPARMCLLCENARLPAAGGAARGQEAGPRDAAQGQPATPPTPPVAGGPRGPRMGRGRARRRAGAPPRA